MKAYVGIMDGLADTVHVDADHGEAAAKAVEAFIDADKPQTRDDKVATIHLCPVDPVKVKDALAGGGFDIEPFNMTKIG